MNREHRYITPPPENPFMLGGNCAIAIVAAAKLLAASAAVAPAAYVITVLWLGVHSCSIPKLLRR